MKCIENSRECMHTDVRVERVLIHLFFFTQDKRLVGYASLSVHHFIWVSSYMVSHFTFSIQSNLLH